MTRAKAPSKRRKTVRHKRHPNDWYVEPRWAVDAFIPVFKRHLFWGTLRRIALTLLSRLDGALIWKVWDPCCGMGTTPTAFKLAGIRAFASDLVARVDDPDLMVAEWAGEYDFLQDTRPRLKVTSIVCNPPYKHTEAFVRKALERASDLVAVIVPLNFLCSGTRFAFFMEEHPPLQIVFMSDRPSMPPGDKIEEMGDAAFKGGSIDYAWIIWDVRRPGKRLPPTWIRKPEEAVA